MPLEVSTVASVVRVVASIRHARDRNALARRTRERGQSGRFVEGGSTAPVGMSAGRGGLGLTAGVGATGAVGGSGRLLLLHPYADTTNGNHQNDWRMTASVSGNEKPLAAEHRRDRGGDRHRLSPCARAHKRRDFIFLVGCGGGTRHRLRRWRAATLRFAERKSHPTSDASIERDDQRRHHGHGFLMRTHTDDGDYWFHHVAAIAGLND